MHTGVTLVARRDSVEAELARILGRRARVTYRHLRQFLNAFQWDPRPPGLLILDVLQLFPEPPDPAVPPLPQECSRVAVVGLRTDVAAVQAAEEKNISVYLLQDLTAPVLAGIAGEGEEVYAQIARLRAEKLYRLLADRWFLRRLSHREREVFDLAMEGLSDQEIAADVQIAVKTVMNHLSQAYSKLGVKGRWEAMARYGHPGRSGSHSGGHCPDDFDG